MFSRGTARFINREDGQINQHDKMDPLICGTEVLLIRGSEFTVSLNQYLLTLKGKECLIVP